MKKQTLTLLTAFLLAASFLPIIAITSEPVQAQPPENTTTRSFGNLDLPDWRDVEVDNSDPKWLEINNADGLVFRFATEKDKFNEIYQDNALIVKDERWLIYFDDKEGGSTAGVEWERLENYNVRVTQFYDDEQSGSGSSYKVVWDFYGGFRPKITIELETGAAGNYKIDWRANLHKDYAENKINYARFWNENDNDAIVFDYSDVYEALGDITKVENVEGWVKGKRFDLYFDVGRLGVENFRLDPNFGYETPGAGSSPINDYVLASWFTCPETGTADNITAYIKVQSTGDKLKCALYKRSDYSFVGGTEEKTGLSTGAQWITFNLSTPKPSLENIDYYIFAWGDKGGLASPLLYYNDELGKGDGKPLTYDSWPSTMTGLTFANHIHSIYCTYTPSAVAPGKPVLVSPENNYSTSDNTPTFVWENGSDATSHRLLIDNSQDFDDGENIYDNTGAWDNSGTVIENELPADTYWWKVAGVANSTENWSENTWTFEVVPRNIAPEIISVACDNTLVDRKLDYPGSTAPKATRIYIEAEDNDGRDGIVLENCRIWIRDNNDTVTIDNLACTGYENIDENTKRFWYDFEPSDALPDENLGAFDVKAQIIDNFGAEDTKDYTSLGFELFTVDDLIATISVDDPTPYRHQRITVSGSVSRVYGTTSLDNAWVLDQIEGTLVTGIVGNTYSATYEVTSNLGATVGVHVRALDLGSGLDSNSSTSYTVVSSPTLWVLLSLGAYEEEEAPADVDPSLQSGTYVGGEWVPRDWFYPGETCFLRAHVRNAGTSDPVTHARVEMTLVYGNLEFEVRQPESGLYEGSLLLVDIPTDGHTIGVEIYAEGYTNWHGEASFSLIEAPVPPPPVVVPWWQQWWAWLGIGAVVAVAVVFVWRWK